MTSACCVEQRRAAAMARLDEVMDPELDEPVTAMGFVEAIAIEGADLKVVFRLPTFWCSANFAYLMGHDMKTALSALPWAQRVTVELVDHFAARPINQGLAQDLPFERVFAGEASAGLDQLRRAFREKAYLGRQASLLQLLRRRLDAETIVALTVSELRVLTGDDDEACRRAAGRYLAARLVDGGPASPGDPAFTRLEGDLIPAAGLIDHLRQCRRIGAAAEANAALCRMQLQARYQGVPSGVGTALERRRDR